MLSRSSRRLGCFGSQPSACRVWALDVAWSAPKIRPGAPQVCAGADSTGTPSRRPMTAAMSRTLSLVGHGEPGRPAPSEASALPRPRAHRCSHRKQPTAVKSHRHRLRPGQGAVTTDRQLRSHHTYKATCTPTKAPPSLVSAHGVPHRRVRTQRIDSASATAHSGPDARRARTTRTRRPPRRAGRSAFPYAETPHRAGPSRCRADRPRRFGLFRLADQISIEPVGPT